MPATAPNPKPTNPKLIAQMVAFHNDPSPKNAKPFYEALLAATLLLPIEASTSEAETVDWTAVAKKPKMAFPRLRGPQGRMGVPVFTDVPSLLARFPKGGNYVPTTAKDLCKLLVERGKFEILVINPAAQQPSGMHIPRMGVEALSRGATPKLE